MDAAAAHAAFVMTMSAARMYWLLRHAQHARYINIHKLHHFPKKNRLRPLCRFSAQWNTPFIQSTVFPPGSFQADLLFVNGHRKFKNTAYVFCRGSRDIISKSRGENRSHGAKTVLAKCAVGELMKIWLQISNKFLLLQLTSS